MPRYNPIKILLPNCKSDDVVPIVTVVNVLQLRNVLSPMASINSGKSIDNTLDSYTPDDGIGIMITVVHLPKQYGGIRSKFLGCITDNNSVQL